MNNIAHDLEVASAFWRGTNGTLVRQAAKYIRQLEEEIKRLQKPEDGQVAKLEKQRDALLRDNQELRPHGFIPWVGGAAPVCTGTRVEVRTRGNTPSVVRRYVCTVGVDCPSWYHNGNSTDIIGYRLVEETSK